MERRFHNLAFILETFVTKGGSNGKRQRLNLANRLAAYFASDDVPRNACIHLAMVDCILDDVLPKVRQQRLKRSSGEDDLGQDQAELAGDFDEG